jgi:hypothetical protein
MRYCTTCAQPFSPAKHYHVQCLPCWRRERDAEAQAGAWSEGYRAGYAAGRLEAVPRSPSATIEPGLVIEIVKLTHPDKHPPERFAEANAVTARLLALREGGSR